MLGAVLREARRHELHDLSEHILDYSNIPGYCKAYRIQAHALGLLGRLADVVVEYAHRRIFGRYSNLLKIPYSQKCQQ